VSCSGCGGPGKILVQAVQCMGVKMQFFINLPHLKEIVVLRASCGKGKSARGLHNGNDYHPKMRSEDCPSILLDGVSGVPTVISHGHSVLTPTKF
jgi:hypothetical protein